MTQLNLAEVDRVRKAVLLPQEEFASLLGVSRQTYSNWLKGRKTPRQRHRDRLLDLVFSLTQLVRSGQWPAPGVRQLGAAGRKDLLTTELAKLHREQEGT